MTDGASSFLETGAVTTLFLVMVAMVGPIKHGRPSSEAAAQLATQAYRPGVDQQYSAPGFRTWAPTGVERRRGDAPLQRQVERAKRAEDQITPMRVALVPLRRAGHRPGRLFLKGVASVAAETTGEGTRLPRRAFHPDDR